VNNSEYDRTATVQSQFQTIVGNAGDNAALLDGKTVQSYASLDRTTNQFARWLRSRGIGKGNFVAILAGRSAGVVVAMLGIMKAGAAYIPLDVGYPAERLAFMVADSAPALVLTDNSVSWDFGLPAGVAVALEEALQAAAFQTDAPVQCDCTADDIAYVMYTSGSTGRPKGVLTCHRSIVRLVRQQAYAPFGPGETLLHLAPLAFDASTFEIWGALLNGGRLGIVGELLPSLDVIVDAIARYRVTTAWFTAGLFNLLVDRKLNGLRPLRYILAGGDVLSPAHVRRAYATLTECQIVNGYGPTENTTFTCCYPVPRSGWDGVAIPVGREISHTRVHLLGPDLCPVPDGEIGQVCCAGDGLAKGYLKRPDLTAEKFIQSPFGAPPYDRLYLTGDLGRRRPDGVVEFRGRMDRQVKINGKRVELEEIENSFRADVTLADAVVVVRQTAAGGKQLAAYLKSSTPWPSNAVASRTAAALARLRLALPEHMIPAEIMVLDAFPLTPNGKVDRDALPVPEQRQRQAQAARPHSKLEEVISEIWGRVLELSAVDRESNFFDLGGTSLQLLAVHAELQSTVRPNIPLMALFAHTNVRELASYLGRSRPEQASQA